MKQVAVKHTPFEFFSEPAAEGWRLAAKFKGFVVFDATLDEEPTEQSIRDTLENQPAAVRRMVSIAATHLAHIWDDSLTPFPDGVMIEFGKCSAEECNHLHMARFHSSILPLSNHAAQPGALTTIPLTRQVRDAEGDDAGTETVHVTLAKLVELEQIYRLPTNVMLQSFLRRELFSPHFHEWTPPTLEELDYIFGVTPFVRTNFPSFTTSSAEKLTYVRSLELLHQRAHEPSLQASKADLHAAWFYIMEALDVWRRGCSLPVTTDANEREVARRHTLN